MKYLEWKIFTNGTATQEDILEYQKLIAMMLMHQEGLL